MKRIKDIDLVKWLKFIFLGGFLIVILYFLYSVYNYNKNSSGGGGTMDNVFEIVPVVGVSLLSDNAINDKARQLFADMADYGTLNSTVLSHFDGVYDTDFIRLYNAFGSPPYDNIGGAMLGFGMPTTLTGWLKEELSDSQYLELKEFYLGTSLF